MIYETPTPGFYRYLDSVLGPEPRQDWMCGQPHVSYAATHTDVFFTQLQEEMWQEQVTECFWATTGKPVAFSSEQAEEIFEDSQNNVSASVYFEKRRLHGTYYLGD